MMGTLVQVKLYTLFTGNLHCKKKQNYLIRFGHMEALLLKKRTLNGHFSRPAETDPYVDTRIERVNKTVLC